MGSLHCVGMCGPLVLTMSVSGKNTMKTAKALSYNAGRVFTYSLLGLIFGGIGKVFLVAGFQQGFSVALGVLLLFALCFPVFSKRFSPFQKFYQWIVYPLQTRIGLGLRSNHLGTTFVVGILNGFLPCGLVYVALAGAAATSGLWQGALYMAIFGLGTTPVMFLLGVLGHHISLPFRQKLLKAVPVFIGMMALLLILRGLNLGIPYLSPEFSTESGRVKTTCCHKP